MLICAKSRTMLDCCEKKNAADRALPANMLNEEAKTDERPMNERKVSFHRRFVESQKELKIVREKLLHSESFNASLQNELSNSAPREDLQHALRSVEQLQQELSIARQALRSESDRHKETQTQLLFAENRIASLEDKVSEVHDELSELHDCRLEIIDLTRRFDLISNDNQGNISAEATSNSEITKAELHTAHTTISCLNAKLEHLRASQKESNGKMMNLLLESKAAIDDYEGHVKRQEYELAELRVDRSKLQRQLEQQRLLLWELEESCHYHRLRWSKLSETYGSTDGVTDHDKRIHELTVEQCRSATAIELLRRKNRHLESLKKTLADEIRKKNDVIIDMSRCCSGTAASESMQEEQERCLSMAAELSVSYVECQMKVDRLTETIDRLKIEQIQKSNTNDQPTPFRSITRNTSYQLENAATPVLDGIKSMSSIFSKSFNTSFSGIDTSNSSKRDDARSSIADVLSLSLPRLDISVSCGNASGINITQVSHVVNNTSILIDSNRNREKVKAALTIDDVNSVIYDPYLKKDGPKNGINSNKVTNPEEPVMVSI